MYCTIKKLAYQFTIHLQISALLQVLKSFSLHLKKHKVVFKIPATRKQISLHQPNLQSCIILETLFRVAIQHIIVLVYRLFGN